MIIFGVDLSINRSAVVWHNGCEYQSSLFSASSNRPNAHKRILAWEELARRIYEHLECVAAGEKYLAIIEGYSLASNRPGHEWILESGGVIKLFLAYNKVPFIEIPPKCLKRYVTGNGNADKPMMIRWLRNEFPALGFDTKKADEWDALGLCLLGKDMANVQGVKDNRTRAIVAEYWHNFWGLEINQLLAKKK